ncbi:SPRY domain-containing protein [Forsythia ovata]|uniref:SPRY domain-containing protein n=1 Tax=Forsythia ovata TaxID=205694 RepID=A0ABD1RL58_9LAMI
MPPPIERINIEFHRDELDPTVLGKLLALAAIAAASVHKYWTSAFEKAADNAELIELLKLAEMYTYRSHVLNCELYKVLAMKVDELRSTVRGDEDVNALRSENKYLGERLAISEDVRARAIYDVTKAKRIHVQAQKKAESQLRSFQNMIHAKDKELTEALSELSRAQDLLANLGVPGYADPKTFSPSPTPFFAQNILSVHCHPKSAVNSHSQHESRQFKRLQFSIEDGLDPEEGYKPWASAIEERNTILGPAFSNSDCEVILMVGLPAFGKTTWAEKWVKEHLERRYVLLGTNLALEQMKTPGRGFNANIVAIRALVWTPIQNIVVKSLPSDITLHNLYQNPIVMPNIEIVSVQEATIGKD